MKKYVSKSLEETKTIAKEILDLLAEQKGNIEEATIVGLSGHLGAGKTAFVKQAASILGVAGEVTSPTFVIMKLYPTANELFPWKQLVHIDAYRLEKPEETEALRLEALVSDPSNLVMIEWPENIGIQKFPGTRMLHFGIQGTEFAIETE